MAGVFPVPNKTSGRKQWALYNGTRKFGGGRFADDGCPESQVVLAKLLLNENTGLEIDREENARLGVYWLIKASEQGHEEATKLLRHCLETRQGITEHNYLDVKTCLVMPHEEKLARRAAKQLFISVSDGDDFITTNQLYECMRRAEIPAKHTNQLGHSSRSIPVDLKTRPLECGMEKVTEEMLMSAASSYSKGELPIVHRALIHVEKAATDYSNTRKYWILCPVVAFNSSCNRIIDTVSRQTFKNLLSILYANLQTILFLWILTQFNVQRIINMLPQCMYFATLITMIISTCQALSINNDLYHFRRWSNLFLMYSNGDLNSNEAEFQHWCRNLKPYALFFTSLLVNLMLTPYIVYVMPIQSEITAIAFICSFMTLCKFAVTWIVFSPPTTPDDSRVHSIRTKWIDFLAFFSFAIHVLARYPYETDSVVSYNWRFLDVHVPSFASYVVGNGIEFCLNFRALFYLIIPAVLIKMASRDNWRGIYTSLIPHSISLAWWQIAVISSQGATWYGLIRSALALVGLVSFLPLAGLTTIILPSVAVVKFLINIIESYPQLTITLVVASFPVFIAFWIGTKKKPLTSLSKKLILTIIQIIMLALTSLALMQMLFDPQDFKSGLTKNVAHLSGVHSTDKISENGGAQEPGDVLPSYLTWPQFQEHCSSQLSCSQLSGLPVRWEGTVYNIKSVRIYNVIGQLIYKLPYRVQSVIKCWFGEEFSFRSDDNTSPINLLGECHISNWDRHEYEIGVVMSSSIWSSVESVVKLIEVDDLYKNMTNFLSEGDRIWFSGYLATRNDGFLDRNSLQISINALGCSICKNELINNKTVQKNSIIAFSIYSSLKAVLNFLFNPLVIFR